MYPFEPVAVTQRSLPRSTRGAQVGRLPRLYRHGSHTVFGGVVRYHHSFEYLRQRLHPTSPSGRRTQRKRFARRPWSSPGLCGPLITAVPEFPVLGSDTAHSPSLPLAIDGGRTRGMAARRLPAASPAAAVGVDDLADACPRGAGKDRYVPSCDSGGIPRAEVRVTLLAGRRSCEKRFCWVKDKDRCRTSTHAAECNHTDTVASLSR